jgi:hypothetical protein
MFTTGNPVEFWALAVTYGTPRDLLARQLDDVPLGGPMRSISMS